jgi:hypothetical protein
MHRLNVVVIPATVPHPSKREAGIHNLYPTGIPPEFTPYLIRGGRGALFKPPNGWNIFYSLWLNMSIVLPNSVLLNRNIFEISEKVHHSLKSGRYFFRALF